MKNLVKEPIGHIMIDTGIFEHGTKEYHSDGNWEPVYAGELEVENNQWQPIETAPKDNKRALYLARFNTKGELIELDFDGAWQHDRESWEMSHIEYDYWCSANGIEDPTHWAYQDEPIPKVKSSCEISESNWLRAIDNELVSTHLGVVEPSDTYENAKKKINDLLCWHIDTATDPLVNGGKKLYPIKTIEKLIECLERAYWVLSSMEQNYGDLWQTNETPESLDALVYKIKKVLKETEDKNAKRA